MRLPNWRQPDSSVSCSAIAADNPSSSATCRAPLSKRQGTGAEASADALYSFWAARKTDVLPVPESPVSSTTGDRLVAECHVSERTSSVCT